MPFNRSVIGSISVYASVLLSGCNTTQHASSQVSAATMLPPGASIAPIVCSSGEAFSFSFMPLAALPDLSGLGYPSLANGAALQATNASGNFNLRLDLCLTSSDVPELQRLINGFFGNIIEEVTIPAQSKIERLKEAIFDEGVDGLLIDIPYETVRLGTPTSVASATDRGVEIRGFQIGDKSFLVAINYKGHDSQGRAIPTAKRALVGTLYEGDALASGHCVGIGNPVLSRFTMAQAVIEFHACRTGGTSGTRSFVVKKVVVTDSDLNVPAGLRGQPQIFAGQDLEAALAYEVNHHNNCDSFLLQTPSATYGYAGPPNVGGCGNTIAGVPEQIRGWEIRYSSGHEVSGVATFSHYIWDNVVGTSVD